MNQSENRPLVRRWFPAVSFAALFLSCILAIGVQTNRIVLRGAALVFPAVCALGGVLLLTHSHSLANAKEELLMELSHIPLALFAIAAGWSRWLELRLPSKYRYVPARIWPVCFVLIGVVLLLYRES